MRERDKAILDDLSRFRCMSRDDIMSIHFHSQKNKIKLCNEVMKRLRRDGYAVADTSRRPYLYFPADSRIKKQSQKIDHYLSLVEIYLDLRRSGTLRQFDVEPKYGKKGTVEPDIFAIWHGSPWYIECQRSIYGEKTMRQKLKRYEQYKREGKWRKLSWQPKEPIFPHVWIIGEKYYDVSDTRLQVYQSKNVQDFLEKIS